MKKLLLVLLTLFMFVTLSYSQKDGDNKLYGVPYITLGAASGLDSVSVSGSCGRSIEFVPGLNNQDLDQDGLAEIILTDYSKGGRVHVFEQIAKNSLDFKLVWQSKPLKKKWNGTYPAGIQSTPRTVTLGDLDGNGKKEVLIPIGYSLADSVNSDTTFQRGIHVYEWTGRDNDYGTEPYVIRPEVFDPDTKNYGFCRMEKGGLLAADVDGDNRQELLIGANTFAFNTDLTKNSGKVYVVSVKSGTFAKRDAVYGSEYIFTKMAKALKNDSDGYVPWCFINADVDGDTKDEIVVGARVNVGYGAGLGFFKATGKDTYIDGNIIDIGDPTKPVSGQNVFRVTGQMGKIKNQGRDVVIFNTDETTTPHRILMLSDVVDIGLVGSNNLTVLKTGNLGTFTGTAIGDQDHGSGTDGFDIYFPDGINGIYDLEYKGTGNIADSNNYSLTSIFDAKKVYRQWQGGLYHVMVPPYDIDNNGKKEILANYQMYANSTTDATAKDTLIYGNIPVPTRNAFWVLEWGDTTMGKKVNVTSARPLNLILPQDYTLEQNYPNPFNPTTTIKFTLPASENLDMIIYDMNGREVRKLIDNQNYAAGSYQIVWDGKNTFGKQVASGMYIYKMKWGNFEKSMKMSFIK